MSERALVTGGAGFIGSNLVKRLMDEGWVVDAVDDLSNGRVEFLPHREPDGMPLCRTFIQGDFADEQLVLSAIKQQAYDVVFHLAAKPRVGYSVEQPAITNDINVQRTVKLLEACRGNVRRFINTSSSSVYGGADALPTPEHTRHNPKSPYALQKAISEQYCRLFNELYGLETVSVRPFNVFGPHQLGDSPYSCAIGAWLHAVKHGRKMRSDGDGQQTRDLTYVDNVVDIMVRCANFSGKFESGAAFNAGAGERTSNNDILTWFKQNFPGSEVQHAPERPGDVKHTQADLYLAGYVLGYKPLVPFWTGLEKTRDWAMASPLF